MAEEIDFENGRFGNFQGPVTLTVTLNPVKLYILVHHFSTSTYIPHFVEIKETFCGRTDIESGFTRSTSVGVDLITKTTQLSQKNNVMRSKRLHLPLIHLGYKFVQLSHKLHFYVTVLSKSVQK